MVNRMQLRKSGLMLAVLATAALAACNAPTDSEAVSSAPATPVAKTVAASTQSSPGKPSAPITIRYKILGTPVVGQPVAIEVDVSSPLREQPMRMSYSVIDSDSMSFPASQPQRIELSIADNERSAARQVTVVPLREGRLYLNVTAEIETDNGVLLKSISVPIAVGQSAAAPDVNGELRQAAEGETVVSMPAREN